MASPNDRHYTTTHEWVKRSGTTVGWFDVGITAFRVNQLGTLTNLAFNVAKDAPITASTSVATLTGNSSSATIHGGLNGTERNEHLYDSSGISQIESDPWNKVIHTMQASNAADYDSLMTAAQYDAFTGGQ